MIFRDQSWREVTIEPKEGYPYPPAAPVFQDLETARDWICHRIDDMDINGLTLILRDAEHPEGVDVPWRMCARCGRRGEPLEDTVEFGMACKDCKGSL